MRLTVFDLSLPLSIGSVEVPNRVALAPMAGVTNSAFRRHLKRHGVGLVVTEMVSAYGLLYDNRRTLTYLDFHDEERPLAVQLFGDRPGLLAEAARRVLERTPQPDLIDLNLGCPVKKVLKTGAGAALAGDPAAAAEAAAALVKSAAAYGVPVTAKIRSGPNAQQISAPELARRLEQAGVSALAVHPRTVEQKYAGRADHRVTAAVVEAVSVPVFASGDVLGLDDARRILSETAAHGVMVARGVQGDPWLVDSLLAGEERPRPTPEELIEELRSLLALASSEMGGSRAARWIRGHLAWYLRPAGVPGRVVDELRRLNEAETLDLALVSLIIRFEPA